MATTPEGKIKKKVTTMLKSLGIWYFFPPANGYGRAGIPDIVCCVAGRFVGIECKADATKKPTALQRHCAKQIREAGGVWFLACDVDSIRGIEAALRVMLAPQ